ncbi:MAG: adenylate/guanylate cyclase domain-containing protein [Spirulinaceae cyanobacterium]
MKIQEISPGIDNFSEGLTEVQLQKSVEEYFPELIGTEEILTEIMAGKQAHFQLQGISRIKENRTDFYFDLSVLKNSDPKSDGELVVFFEDVTPRMLLEQSLVQASNETSLLLNALTASKAYIDRLVDSLADALLVTDEAGVIKAVNQAAKDLLGYTELELIGQHISNIIINNDFLCRVNKNSLALSSNLFQDVETLCLKKSGQRIPVSFSCSIIKKYLDNSSKNQNFEEDKIYIGRDITERLRVEKALRIEQEKAEKLLLNILPSSIAEQLKAQKSTIAENFAEVTVLFADIVGFTKIAASITPSKLVEILNLIFSEFDQLIGKHNLEKIKTIGDAYMVVGGLPLPRDDHANSIAQMALDMQAAISQVSIRTQNDFSLRIGIHTGPVVAGVIGKKKFSYDLWGDTVNIASRMESHSLPGKIQVSEVTYQLLQDQYLLKERGQVYIKGMGQMKTYFLVS